MIFNYIHHYRTLVGQEKRGCQKLSRHNVSERYAMAVVIVGNGTAHLSEDLGTEGERILSNFYKILFPMWVPAVVWVSLIEGTTY